MSIYEGAHLLCSVKLPPQKVFSKLPKKGLQQPLQVVGLSEAVANRVTIILEADSKAAQQGAANVIGATEKDKWLLIRCVLPTEHKSPIVEVCMQSIALALPAVATHKIRRSFIACCWDSSGSEGLDEAPIASGNVGSSEWAAFVRVLRRILNTYTSNEHVQTQKRKSNKVQHQYSDQDLKSRLGKSHTAESAWAQLLKSTYHKSRQQDPSLSPLKQSGSFCNPETAELLHSPMQPNVSSNSHGSPFSLNSTPSPAPSKPKRRKKMKTPPSNGSQSVDFSASLDRMDEDLSSLHCHLPRILCALHFVYEDFKLNTLRRYLDDHFAGRLLYSFLCCFFQPKFGSYGFDLV